MAGKRLLKYDLRVHALSTKPPTTQGHLRARCGRQIIDIKVSDIVAEVDCERCKDVLELELFRKIRAETQGTFSKLGDRLWSHWGF